MATYIVLLGPPGVGKGTQAAIMEEKTGIVHISSGDLFRENIKNQTELGKLAQTYMSKGELVPDDVTIAMIRQRLQMPDCVNGAILDGFPRTPPQADALDKMLSEAFNSKVNRVISITADGHTVAGRIKDRWQCRAHNHVVSAKEVDITAPCKHDGSEFFQRDDDTVAETVATRITVYIEATAPLVNHYSQNRPDAFREIDGLPAQDKVTQAIMDVLEPTPISVSAPTLVKHTVDA